MKSKFYILIIKNKSKFYIIIYNFVYKNIYVLKNKVYVDICKYSFDYKYPNDVYLCYKVDK